MEELLLGFFLAVQELHVVDKKNVGTAVAATEVVEIALLDRLDKLVREFFAGQINDLELRTGLQDILPDRLHEMGLAETGPAVNEKRVVSRANPRRDGLACRMGKLVVSAHDKAVESVERIETRSFQ